MPLPHKMAATRRYLVVLQLWVLPKMIHLQAPLEARTILLQLEVLIRLENKTQPPLLRQILMDTGQPPVQVDRSGIPSKLSMTIHRRVAEGKRRDVKGPAAKVNRPPCHS